jgi:predicted nucleic acid-binding protein
VVSTLLDTNILIDYLNGIPEAKLELERYSDSAISVITWMEVMVGTSAHNVDGTRAFLAGFILLPIDAPVSQRAVELRQGKRIKLPDAIVWATAQVHRRLFVTRNFKDFAPDEPGVRVPYLTRSAAFSRTDFTSLATNRSSG